MQLFKQSLRSILFTATVLAAPLTMAATAELLWQVDGFDQPESVISNKQATRLFVSNMNGEGGEKNGLGYISLLDLQGNILQKQWITGLNAPKGMAISCDTLYVADIDHVVVISITSGKIIDKIPVDGAHFLNDVTVDARGHVYISDLMGGTIYKLNNGVVTPWFNNERLPHPNGVSWHQDQLMVASWGKNIKADFSTEQNGSLYRIDPVTKALKRRSASEYLGNLDGLAHYRQAHYVSDWITGEVFELKGKQINLLLQLPTGAADISIKEGKLWVPLMLDGQVQGYQL
ncbi:YncE family protein [Motilimonas pumila]|uniref:ATP/GTP-binding protein n=1 Tax=Motilimonas pumila TaxID=2303987 RepID=A0A418YFH7_9GAMM|nr:ATP/GTP-binding protein [Motilimonas pumila]RJG48143.1 ATP/GTP-binding protein [Motilimonas pumila]